ncbi:MAG TPA: signal peptidase I [Fimbriimonas sp.]
MRSFLVLLGVIAAWVLTRFQPYPFIVVRGDSMEPTLRNGQFALLDRSEGAVRRGDVVVFRRGGTRCVKRALYLPGDVYCEVRTRDGDWFLAASPKALEVGERRGWARWRRVPPGRIFVVGDNAVMSSDSRSFGTVALRAVEGIVAGYSRPVRGEYSGSRHTAASSAMMLHRSANCYGSARPAQT